MKQTLIITSIANDQNPILKQWAKEAKENNTDFIVIGDKKSPDNMMFEYGDFYSAERQEALHFKLAKILPFNHYSRKNIGYLLAMAKGSEVIIETDDDNKPMDNFWYKKEPDKCCNFIIDAGWVNIYKWFSDSGIWARGFPIEKLKVNISQISSNISDCCTPGGGCC
jgi:hypothetical protein